MAFLGVPNAKLAMTVVAPGPQLARFRDCSGVPISSSHGYDLLVAHTHLDRAMAIRGVPNAKLAMTILAPGPQLARVRDCSGVLSSSSHGHDLLVVHTHLDRGMALRGLPNACTVFQLKPVAPTCIDVENIMQEKAIHVTHRKNISSACDVGNGLKLRSSS